MVPIAIYADRALTPSRKSVMLSLLVEEGKIAAIGRRGELALPVSVQEHSARGMTVVPGFIDVHIHGAGGSDLMEETPEALDMVVTTVGRHGTTSLVARQSRRLKNVSAAALPPLLDTSDRSRGAQESRCLRRRFWAYTLKGHSSVTRGAASIQWSGSCRRRSTYSSATSPRPTGQPGF